MLSCKEIVKQASRNIDAELVWHEKVGFKMHLMMCKTCRRYTKQLKFIQHAVVNRSTQGLTDKTIKLSTEARARITKALSKY